MDTDVAVCVGCSYRRDVEMSWRRMTTTGSRSNQTRTAWDRLGLPDADVILLLCNSTKSKSSEDGTKWTGTCWPMPEETMRTSDSSDFG